MFITVFGIKFIYTALILLCIVDERMPVEINLIALMRYIEITMTVGIDVSCFW